jgi:hypothetical protein
MMKKILLTLSLVTLAAPAFARPVVVELYTSEACSSCPPADALLASLKATDPDILPLSFHVTYWNGPAWTDKFSLKQATDRQAWYAGIHNSQDVYTPEAVVEGGSGLVGSNRGDVTAAIAAAKQAMAPAIPVSVAGGAMLTLTVGSTTAAGQAQIWLFGFDSKHVTQIGGGENGGATLTETNVVRSVSSLGNWVGGMQSFTIPRPPGEHTAVVLQETSGTIDGAAAD